MECEFVLPLQPQDLELAAAQEANGYQVRSKIEPHFMAEAKLLSVLGEATARVLADFVAIAHHSVFDPLYSVACASKFDALSGRAKREVAEALVESVNKFLRQLPTFKLSSSNHSASRPFRTAVKMHALLLCALATRAEKAEETSRMIKKPVVAAPKGKGARGKKKQQEEEDEQSGWDWMSTKEQVLGSLVDVAESQHVKALWPLASPEKEFGALMFQLCTSMLENKANFNAKTKPLTDLIYKLFALTVKDYGLVVRASTALMHLLHNFEHVPMPVATLLKLCSEQYAMHRLVASVIHEIGRLEVKFLARDNTGAKNIALFLEEIASSLPNTILIHVPVLLPHLDGESYLIRNGIVRLLGQVIEKAFSGDVGSDEASSSSKKVGKKKLVRKKDRHEGEGEDDDSEEPESDKENAEADNGQNREDDEEELDESRDKENLKKTRDELFDILLERALDITSFTRSKVLQQLQHLTEAKCIPLARVSQVAHLALGRLQDKTVQVRKNAIQLLISMLEYNNFGATLALEPFTARAREGAEKLKAKLLARNNSAPAKPKNEEMTDEEVSGLVSDKAVIAQDEADNAQLQQEREALDLHFEAVKFIEAINAATPILTQLLNSKTSSDILECVRFFVVAHEFQIDSAPLGIRKMLVLIWSKEQSVVDAVMEAYRRLYIGNADFTLVREIQSGLALSIARNLIRLPTGASMSYLTSLEELLSKMTKADLMPAPVISALWDIFTNAAGNDEISRLNSLTLLSMLSSSSMIIDRLAVLVSVGLGPRASLPLKRMACVALQKISVEQVREIKEKTRDRLIQILVVLLTTSCTGTVAREWYPTACEALNALFILSDKPEIEAKEILTSLLKQALHNSHDNHHEEVVKVGNAELLSRLFFVVGHVSVKMLVYLEAMEQKVKKARIQMRVDKKKIEEEQTKKKRSGKGEKEKETKEQGDIEDELAVGASEEYEIEQLREEAEQQMVKGKDSLLGPFGPAVVAVCSQPHKFPHVALQQSAVLALCKLMCISAEFCETHLRLLFTILTKSRDAASRANILVALGDMSFRFPNLIEPWAPYMYACLNDESVRKHALMVLTHLILNDMQKAKRPVADIAKCLVDADPRISNLAKMFFNELALKGKNPVYNLLPDIISRLSNDATVSADHFRAILKFLITFIQKDKESESLIEKLCHRFEQMDIDSAILHAAPQAEGEAMVLIAAPDTAQDDHEPTHDKAESPEAHAVLLLKQCRYVAYCLAQLTFSSPGAVKKLVDCFRLYGPKLGDKDIYENFVGLVNKAKKVVGIKPEQKQVLEDLLVKFSEVHEKALEDQQAHFKANTARGKHAGAKDRPKNESEDEAVASAPASKRTSKGLPPRRGRLANAPVKRPARRGKKESSSGSEEESSFDEQESVDSEMDAPPVKKKMAVKKLAQVTTNKTTAKTKQVSSDDDSEDAPKLPSKKGKVKESSSEEESESSESESESESSEASESEEELPKSTTRITTKKR